MEPEMFRAPREETAQEMATGCNEISTEHWDLKPPSLIQLQDVSSQA